VIPDPIVAEVCIESAADAAAAEAGGADRLELCADLAAGGLTPSVDTVHEVLAATRLPVVAMVRCRGGDFRYTSDEHAEMGKQAQTLLALGVSGIVYGSVDAEGMPEIESLRRMRAAASTASRGRAELVFHRAFDHVRDPLVALEMLIDCGVDRVLTSGHPDGVEAGVEALRQLVEAVDGRITVMPGGGVREENLAAIVTATGAKEIHFSARPDPHVPTEATAIATFVGIVRATVKS
jgi:copper homeostasis protein